MNESKTQLMRAVESDGWEVTDRSLEDAMMDCVGNDVLEWHFAISLALNDLFVGDVLAAQRRLRELMAKTGEYVTGFDLDRDSQ